MINHSSLQRIALGLEYEGTGFHGWQRQSKELSVQGAVETALSRVASEAISVVAAGRTDTGVHATHQVVHFDTQVFRSERAWVYGANTFLPPSVRVLWARSVPTTFNARKSALSRRYRYLVYNQPLRPSLFRAQVGWYYRKLDIQKMRDGAEYWLGEQDFSSFRASECQSKSPMRRMIEITIEPWDNGWINMEFEANAFLHHMVRNMVGALWKIGADTGVSPEWAKTLLLAKDRRLASITAPPQGLYLIAVRYPESLGLPVAKSNNVWSRIS